MNKKRLLIVEDEELLRRQYADILRPLDADLDMASTRQQALDLVQRKTYHLALIDIMLTGQRADRGGEEVMKRLRQLDEGTEMIVLSGAEEVEVPVDALQRYGARRYIMKQRVRRAEDILEPVREVLAVSPGLKLYGRYRSLLDFLAAGRGELLWVDEALRLLKPLDGWSGLNSFIDWFCGPLAPVLPRRNRKTASDFDNVRHLLYGDFWSKAIGSEVVLFAGNRENVGDKGPTPDVPAKLVRHDTKARVAGWVYGVEGADRGEFVDSVYDI